MAQVTQRLGPSRAEVLDLLRNLGEPVPVATVARAMNLHQNTTRFHLEALAEAGLVTREVEQRESPGRPRTLYRAVASRDKDHFRQFARAMVRHFAARTDDRVDQSRAAGEAWGVEMRREARLLEPQQQPLDRLVGAMDRLGYRPQFQDGAEPTLVLRHCPFLELAGAQPDVVCELHLGLARGLLGTDTPWRATSLEPWAGPDHCLLHLARLGSSPPPPALGPAAEIEAAPADHADD